MLLSICFSASTIGSVVGAGGGVIIKPVLDFTGLMPTATASFCSGCMVLAMSAVSLIAGAFAGRALSARLKNCGVERLLQGLAVCFIALKLFKMFKIAQIQATILHFLTVTFAG